MPRAFIVTNERDRARVIEIIGKLNLAVPWALTWRRHKSKRTLNQNALYHLMIEVIAKDTGNSHNDVHEWARAEFLPPAFVTVNGKSRECRRSTTSLDTREMSEYIDRIYAWAASELGIVLPHPDDLGREVA